MKEVLVQVKNLSTAFKSEGKLIKIIDDVSFDIYRGEVLGIVGESGSGKSVTSKTIMRLLPEPPARILGGQILFEGDPAQDVLQFNEKQLCRFRGEKAAMIFQEPMTSLNPVLTCGYQISEAILQHKDLSKSSAREKAIRMLKKVGIQSPETRYNCYPHELSGGMRQRVMIAMALACEPRLIIADEPTTALDVTIQAQILDLFNDLKSRINGSILLITHDLGVIAEMADYVVVMYAGRIIEQGTVSEIFHNPCHPYTQGLQKSKPTMNSSEDQLFNIPGNVPNPVDMPANCYFKERCSQCIGKCSGEYPGMVQVSPTHFVACHLYAPKED